MVYITIKEVGDGRSRDGGPWISNPHQLANMIEHEGGVVAAVEYGIRATDFTDAPKVAVLKRLWAQLEAAYIPVEELVDEITDITDDLDWSEGVTIDPTPPS